MPFHLPETVAKPLVLAYLNYICLQDKRITCQVELWAQSTHSRFILTTHRKQFLETRFGSVKLRALKTQTKKDEKRYKPSGWEQLRSRGE